MTSQSLESQLRVRLIDPLLQRWGHNAIDFAYFGQNIERLDAQAMSAHLGVVRSVQERSRGRCEHATGSAPQQASGTPVTVTPAWLPFWQQPYGDIDSADRQCRQQSKNLVKPGAYHHLVLLGVTRQRVRQDHYPSRTTPIHPGKRGHSVGLLIGCNTHIAPHALDYPTSSSYARISIDRKW